MAVFSGPQFELIASSTVTLADASDLPHTHDLTLIASKTNSTTVSTTPNSTLPLFGHFCCRLAIRPDCIDRASFSGCLSMPPTSDGFARLQAFRLDLWDDEEAFRSNASPRRSIDVTRDTKLKLKTETDLVLGIMEEGTMHEHTLRASAPSEGTRWYKLIKATIQEHLQWKNIMSEPIMELVAAGNSRSLLLRASRLVSLYDQVPILGKYRLSH